ncbi:unnamed protein product [Phytophthora lilii]|uniref:Unnamed protein product n=1 Tax=Phytophthora lilii TaxID=2077276 RepID=A0A9W6YJ99_9STRA|nr:unnamed protein product [Phytophthora lilii]
MDTAEMSEFWPRTVAATQRIMFNTTCSADLDVCHVRVKDIHELEDMINDILKAEECCSTRESSSRYSQGRDVPRRRDQRRPEDSYDSNRRERRERDSGRRRDDSRREEPRYQPRVTLTEASMADIMAELQVREPQASRASTSKSLGRVLSTDAAGCDDEWNDRGDQYSDKELGDVMTTHPMAMTNTSQPQTTPSEE